MGIGMATQLGYNSMLAACILCMYRLFMEGGPIQTSWPDTRQSFWVYIMQKTKAEGGGENGKSAQTQCVYTCIHCTNDVRNMS